MVIGIRYEWILIISSNSTCNFSVTNQLFYFLKLYDMHQIIQHENNVWNDLKWFFLQCSELSAFLAVIFWLKIQYIFSLSVWSHFSFFSDNIVIVHFCRNHLYYTFQIYFNELYCILLWSFSHVFFFFLILQLWYICNEIGSICMF